MSDKIMNVIVGIAGLIIIVCIFFWGWALRQRQILDKYCTGKGANYVIILNNNTCVKGSVIEVIEWMK